MMRTYWAQEPTGAIGAEVEGRAKKYQDLTTYNGRRNLWRRAARTMYGLDPEQGFGRTSGMVQFSGPERENVELRANLYRAIVRQLVAMTCSSRPSFRCKSQAYDAETDEVREIGDAILDNALNERLEAQIWECVTNMLTLGEGWIGITWDPLRGPTGPNGAPMGDYESRVFRPDQVIRDASAENVETDWIILVTRRNRWTLAGLYPEHADKIINATSQTSVDLWTEFRVRATGADEDHVQVLEFYHRPTPALPEGRASLVVGGVAIADGPNPYGRLPAYCMKVTQEPGSAYGYADSWDLLALQQCVDATVVQMQTTMENYGTPWLFTPDGAGYDLQNIGTAKQLTGTTAPVVLDIGSRNVEGTVAYLDALSSFMQRISGLNDAATGDAGKGAAAQQVALLQQIAVQQNSRNQFAYVAAFSQAMEGLLDVYKRFATSERVTYIAGANRAPLVKRWSAADISVLDGVLVEMGSAAMRTSAMRRDMAQTLAASGMFGTPQAEQFVAFVEKGRLETLTEDARACEVQIERENQALLEGAPVKALVTDDHVRHIKGHRSLLDDPQTRFDDALAGAVFAHLAEHVQQWNGASSTPDGMAVLMATGQQPSPAAQLMMQAGPPAPPAPGPAEPPPQNPEVGNVESNGVPVDGGSEPSADVPPAELPPGAAQTV